MTGARNTRRRRTRFWNTAAPVCSVAVVVAGWELITRAAPSTYFPPPSQIAVRLGELWFTGPPSHAFLTDAALAHIPPSMARLLGAWLLACAIGVGVGLLLGRNAVLAECCEPLIHFFRAIPPTVLLPVWIVLLKIGDQMQVVTIVFGVIWPILINTMDGARSVQPLQEDTVKVFRLSGPQRLWSVILPAALPKIFAGLRLSLSLALILMVISEVMGGSTNGIGFSLLAETQRTYDIPAMWGGIVILGALGFGLNSALLAIERRALAPHGLTGSHA